MKTNKWFLISVALNAVTVALLIALALRPAPPPMPPAPAPQAEVRRPAGPAPKPAAVAEATNAPGAWIQTLRAAGIAEKLVADVAAADFDDRWQKRMRDMQKQF